MFKVLANFGSYYPFQQQVGKKWQVEDEETVTNASFAEKYFLVFNMDEVKYVRYYILHGDKLKNSSKRSRM